MRDAPPFGTPWRCSCRKPRKSTRFSLPAALDQAPSGADPRPLIAPRPHDTAPPGRYTLRAGEHAILNTLRSGENAMIEIDAQSSSDDPIEAALTQFVTAWYDGKPPDLDEFMHE